MSEQVSEPTSPARQRTDAVRDTIAVVALCSLFAVLDVAGMAYILVKQPGQQVTVMITFGGLVVLAMFLALIYYLLVNPVYGRARTSAARSSRAR